MKVCPPEHKHGQSTTCYHLHQCRCDPCRAHAAAHAAHRRKQQAYGRYDDGLVDAAPVREHVHELLRFGIGWKRIAMLSGVGATAVSQLIYGRKGSNKDPRKGEVLKRISRETARKLFTVEPVFENLAQGTPVPAFGAHRRVQALVFNGWSLSKIGDRIGVTPANMGTFMRRKSTSVATYLKVRAVFEELWDQEPPRDEWRDKIAYSRSKKFARANGWVSAFAWDDIDNPRERAKGAA